MSKNVCICQRAYASRVLVGVVVYQSSGHHIGKKEFALCATKGSFSH